MVRTRFFRRRSLRVAVPSLALCGVLAGIALFGGSTANATVCTPNAGEGCVDITGGTLTFTAPTTLAFPSTSITGLDQWVYDQRAADQKIVVNDARGLLGVGSGWNVGVVASTFTCTTTGTCGGDTLGAFKLNGSTSANDDTTAPSSACTASSTCTPPTNSLASSYPVTMTTDGSTLNKVFTAAQDTGLGSITLGDTPDPIVWWLGIPATARIGTYTSTLTLSINAGP